MADFSTSVLAVRGCRIRLMRGGAGSPLVVLHGASGANVLPFMQQLAQKFDVIAPEHPGFGESDTPDWLDNIHDLAYFYLDVLDELKLKDVNLVGLSFGGWIATELAVRNTQRLASLTLCGAAGLYLAGVEQLDPFLRSDEQRLRDFFYDQKKAEDIIARALRPELEDVTLKNRTTVAKIAWQPRGHDPNLGKWLHRIDVPTLLIWGDHDRMFPKEHALAYQKAIPGAKVVIVPECGHVPQIEKPDAFVAALETFLGVPPPYPPPQAREGEWGSRIGSNHEVLQLPSDAVCARRSRRHRQERLGLGDVLEQPLRSGERRRALPRLSRPDGVRRPARLRRRLPQRASSDRLRHDADPRRAGRRAGAQRQARQDRHFGPRAAAAEQSAEHRRRIRDARQSHPRPHHRRLRARHRRRISRHRHQSGHFAGALCRGARSDRAGLDRAGAVFLFRKTLSVPLRQSVAAALSDAASADLDSVARLRLDHPLGGEDALHLLPDAQSDRRGGEILSALSRRGRQGRLPGVARPARLVEHHLCRRDRQEGGAKRQSRISKRWSIIF